MIANHRADETPVRIECIAPILRVEDMAASVRYYVDVLGFAKAGWSDDDFAYLSRDGQGIYLCHGEQGHAGTWVWNGVENVRALYAEFQARGAIIRHGPKNFPWAVEIQLEDPDGHVLRFGSEPEPPND